MFKFRKRKEVKDDRYKPLHIALYGKTLEQANYVLERIVKANKDDFNNIQLSGFGGFAIFKNGDIISCCAENSPKSHFRGVHYDQAYIIEGSLVNEDLVDSLELSNVPNNYLFQCITYNGEEYVKASMKNKLLIKFNSVEDYDKYLESVKDFKSDINLECGSIIVDGKSNLGVRNLGIGKEITACLISLNKTEIEKFNEALKDFLV